MAPDMRSILRFFGVILFLLLGFVFYIFLTTGYFRSIDNMSDRVSDTLLIKGAEDIAISRTDSFLIVSSTDRRLAADQGIIEGGLYFVDLKTSEFRTEKIETSWKGNFAPHGISMFRIGPGYYRIMAINHAEGHSVEVFEWKDSKMSHLETLKNDLMVSPNDLVMVSENEFYFTNDHKYTSGIGRFAEDYGGLALSNVIFFDGTSYREVASGIAYANGINFDSSRKLLYVASPRSFEINVYDVNEDGTLAFQSIIPCGTGIDNLELDENGDIWTAGHPNLLKFTSYAAGKSDISPSEVLRISYRDKSDYSIQQVYVEDGQILSGSSVAVPFGPYVFVGSVMDDEVLIINL